MSTGTAQAQASELDRLAEDVRRDGICIIPGLFSSDLIGEWAKAFRSLWEDRRSRPGVLAPREEARFYLTLPWVAPFSNQEIFANPVILGVIQRVFAQDFDMVQLGADVSLPGSEFQPIHKDFQHIFPDMITPLYALAVNLPLLPVTEENGPFQMARGTHALPRRGCCKDRVGRDCIGVLLFRTRRRDDPHPHSHSTGTPNHTDSPRVIAVMGYVMRWFNTANVHMTIERNYYETLPQDIRTMLRCDVVETLEEPEPERFTNFKF